MRSMISSSERALARADFRRFWPLLFGYAVLWLCALPLSLWSRHDYLSSRRPMEAMASVSNYFYNASRASIYVSAFFAVLLAMALLHTRGCSVRDDLQTLRQENSRHWRRKLLCLLVILAAVGTVYILRTGDGMLSVSVGEQRARNWLERVLLFRPRTKEFLIAYPAIAAAYCCAAHRSRLTAWLFGVFGAIGFASVANTFCHIRAHFLVSLLRTGIGLALGLVLGMLILLFLRACWPAPSDATQTKE